MIRNKYIVSSLRCLAAAVALATIVVRPALADSLTFAQVIESGGPLQQWVISNSGDTTTITASGSSSFAFFGITGLPFAGLQNATFHLTATTTQAGNCANGCNSNDHYSQPGYTGTFSYTDDALGTNLLSGVFTANGDPQTTGALFSSTIGTSGATFAASMVSSNVTELNLSSDYIDFSQHAQEAATFSLSSLVPVFATGAVADGHAYPDGTILFNGAGSGTFSADLSPAPEPATFGLIGGAMFALGILRRKKAVRG